MLWRPLPPHLAELAAVEPPRWRQAWAAAFGAVFVALGARGLWEIARTAQTHRAPLDGMVGTAVPLALFTGAWLLVLHWALLGAVAKLRLRQFVATWLAPGERVRFAGMVRLPRRPPTRGRDLLAEWRRWRRAGVLVCTDRRLLLVRPRGLRYPSLTWPREGIAEVAGTPDGRRSLLSAGMADGGCIELWMATREELAEAEAVLARAGRAPASLRGSTAGAS